MPNSNFFRLKYNETVYQYNADFPQWEVYIGLHIKLCSDAHFSVHIIF